MAGAAAGCLSRHLSREIDVMYCFLMVRVSLLLVLGLAAGCDGRAPLASASLLSGESSLSESNALVAASLVLTNHD